MLTTEDIKAEITLIESLLLTKKRQLTRLHAIEHGFQWQEVSDRILILRDPQERYGWKSCTYLGFTTKKEAEDCLSYVRKNKLAASVEGPRQAERIVGFKWELKCCDLTRETVERCHKKQTEAIATAA